jgi:hypothetical protein
VYTLAKPTAKMKSAAKTAKITAFVSTLLGGHRVDPLRLEMSAMLYSTSAVRGTDVMSGNERAQPAYVTTRGRSTMHAVVRTFSGPAAVGYVAGVQAGKSKLSSVQ